MESQSSEAIVVGADLNGLGVARSLARSGIPLTIVDTDLSKPTMWTRFGRKTKVRTLSIDETLGVSIVDELLRLRTSFARNPVLFMTQEHTVMAVLDRRREIEAQFQVSLPPTDIAKLLLDKTSFHEFAQKEGFRVPRSAILSNSADLAKVNDLRYPCVIKPTMKYAAYGQHFKKAYKVETADRAVEIGGEMLRLAPHLIIQEWVDGGDEDVYFCLQYYNRGAALRGSFTGRKIRQWPPDTGGTASCVAAPEAASQLDKDTTAFFARCGFIGLCSMEYKRDRRDGQYYMIEPTVCRTDYQEEIATLCGVNLPAIAYREEVGAPPHGASDPRSNAGAEGSPGVRSNFIWRDPLGAKNASNARPNAAIDRLEMNYRTVDAYFRPLDPGPWLGLYWQSACRRLLGP